MSKSNFSTRSFAASMTLAAAAMLAPTVVLATGAKPDVDSAKLNSVITGPCKAEFAKFISATEDPDAPGIVILRGAKVEKAALELVTCERAHGAKPPPKLLEIANPTPK